MYKSVLPKVVDADDLESKSRRSRHRIYALHINSAVLSELRTIQFKAPQLPQDVRHEDTVLQSPLCICGAKYTTTPWSHEISEDVTVPRSLIYDAVDDMSDFLAVRLLSRSWRVLIMISLLKSAHKPLSDMVGPRQSQMQVRLTGASGTHSYQNVMTLTETEAKQEKCGSVMA